jgi:serine phosphatase RsbU (regulator of sigma subunit)
MLQPWWAAMDQYVTAVALLVHPQKDDFFASQAGIPDFWQRPVGWVGLGGVPRGQPLGMPVPETYNEASISFRPGATLLTCSDGVTEAENPAGQQFGHGHFTHFLAGLPASATPRQVVDGLFQQVSAFVGAGWPQDDTTALCLHRQP